MRTEEEAKFEVLQPRWTLSIREWVVREEQFSKIQDLLDKINAHLESVSLAPAGPPYARFHDAKQRLAMDVEVGFPVVEATRGHGRMAAGALPGGRVASIWHVGPYADIHFTHEALEKFIHYNGLEPGSGPWEVYWSPLADRGKDDFRVQVFWPIKSME